MSSNYKAINSQTPHFLTFTIVGWIDIFTRNLYKDLFVQSLQYCTENKGLCLHAWVIMTNHVHLIVSTKEKTIPDFVRAIKKYSCKTIIEAIQQNKRESRKDWMLNMFDYAGKTNNDNMYFQLWKQGYHPIELSTLRRKTLCLPAL